MSIFKQITFVCLFITAAVTAQTKKDVSLEDTWKKGVFRTERLESLRSMKNGSQYSVLHRDAQTGETSVDIYDYKTSEKVNTLVNSALSTDVPVFSNYSFNANESQILLATEIESIFRHSTLGIFYIYDIETNSIFKLEDYKVQEPTFSPDGKKIAYVYKNNIYVKNLKTLKTTQVTFDGVSNKIINGVTDWVYEEEFGFVRAFDWNVASNQIAFIRFDETEVTEFSMDIYGSLPSKLYPSQNKFKYPKAGEKNSKVSLHVYNLETNKKKAVKVLKTYKNDFYIPKIKWTNESNILSAQFINRHQNNLDLWFINTITNKPKLVLSEKNKTYINIPTPTFLKDNSFIWTSEKDGFNHIYHYSKTGKLINQVTKGKWEVISFYGYSPKSKRVYFQSTEFGSINRDIFSVKINGRSKRRLTSKLGNNQASFSADFSNYINLYSSSETPPVYTLNDVSCGKVIRVIKDNSELSKVLEGYNLSKKEYSTISVNGNDLNMYLYKPLNFDPNKKYPLFMTQYSGPGSQSVTNSWGSTNDYWAQHLAAKGYVVACVDGRGTGGKGAAFKKVTQKELGKYEVEDQIGAAKLLGARPYIDESRIGIYGWSFGGFMSTSCILKGNDVFKMAIAVAPVTSWRLYDSIYTERYMTTPQENPSGYDQNSPLYHADKLKGDYLLIHGTSDDNVHVQNTMLMVKALIRADKQFEWAIYPDKNHGIYGGNTRFHLFKKMTNFIEKSLGNK